MVSAACLCSDFLAFRVAPAPLRHLEFPQQGVPRGAAQTQRGPFPRRRAPRGRPQASRQALQPGALQRRLFTSRRPAPRSAGRSDSCVIGRAACQSLGTFPGVGRPSPQHFLVPGPVPLPRPGIPSSAVVPEPGLGLYPVPGLGAGRGEQDAAPPEPPPSGKPAWRSGDGLGGREPGTGPFRAWMGRDLVWSRELRPGQAAWASPLLGSGARGPRTPGASGAAGSGCGESLTRAEGGGCACALRGRACLGTACRRRAGGVPGLQTHPGWGRVCRRQSLYSVGDRFWKQCAQVMGRKITLYRALSKC